MSPVDGPEATARQWAYDPSRTLTIDGQKVPAERLRAEYRQTLHRTLSTATADQWADGLSWYGRASATAAIVADAAGRPGNVTFGADILAVLSPAVAWRHNVTAALDVAVGMSPADIVYQGYRSNLERAVAYRASADRGLVRGPKVCPFAVTMVDYLAADIMPVIDRHMAGPRLLPWHRPKNLENVAVRETLAMAIVDVAAWYGHLPSGIQGTVWVIVRPPDTETSAAAARSLPVPF
jgi:hypothetical protein